ncbi:hypothetical protein TPY_3558 [Sulfobacillus acidophilus TPY]|uniref:DUF2029 domain-containing protein n=1 Tax=Sulfobacillus acidophilus (strain ATCC 700253 / DSM 10332 / NAL) TaxID=679936 RepID=G8TWF8_SULAD|nr:hypothetical protein TPY_3558 [Sulfobacillus acidophilus TPY]AEW04856.1 hypothetical protein Sulac_1359 [Sulfobacillus acidophilus DSM 10332]
MQRQFVRVGILFVLFIIAAFGVVWRMPQYDVVEYAFYAKAAFFPPWFHFWPREYPTLSLGVFLLPRLWPLPYRWAFAVTMAGFLAVLLWQGGAFRSRPAWGIRLLIYLFLGAVGLFAQRYDITAAWAAYMALLAARQGQWGRAWGFSLVGVFLKLFPVIFWPMFFIAEYRASGRWRWDRAALAVAVTLVVIGFQIALAVPHQLSWWRYFWNRPIAIGSLPASITVLLHPYRLGVAYGSWNVYAAGWAHRVASGVTVLSGVIWIGLFYAQWRGRLSLESTVLLGIGVLMLSSKVLSVQYLIWLAPFLADRRIHPFFLLSYALNTIVYPLGFVIPGWFSFVVYLLAIRNALLILGFISLWRNERLPTTAQPTPMPTVSA